VREKAVFLYANELARPSENPKNGKTDSLLIAHRGKLVFESYFRRGRANFPHYQMSITKSYTTLAVGRAIQLGYLSMKDLDKPVVHFLNDIKSGMLTPGADQITLHQTMHMTSGIRMSNKNIEEIILQPKLLLGQGHIQAYLQFSAPISPHPRPYKYQPSDPSITMQVLESVVPGSAKTFIKDELLRPMGISNYGWQEDVSGFPKAAAGASMLSRDMIKMGLLILSRGKWKGIQHIPESFLEIATSPLVQTNEENFYGYFWWSQVREINGRKYPMIQGRGAGGQFIFVFPNIDLVVVTTAHNQGMCKMLKELPERMIPLFN
jgi:CubicO group peptidase (beta-lactamase class C family)